jgi:hypothetical protein
LGENRYFNEFLELCGDFPILLQYLFWVSHKSDVGEESDIPWNIEILEEIFFGKVMLIFSTRHHLENFLPCWRGKVAKESQAT